MRSVVVTGVSTGIGWGTAKTLLANGFRVFGSVRKQADADRLKKELGANFVPLIFDVTDEKAVRAAAAQVQTELKGETLAGLVNNAGVAVSGPLLYLPLEEFRQQMEINVTGVFIVTQAFAPLLGVDRSAKGSPGRVVNISSVAGKRAMPFLGPYAASKHALEALSDSLRRELFMFGIDVVIIGPGAVKTPIWDKAEQVDATRYANTPYAKALDRIKAYMLESGRKGLPVERLGQVVLTALTTPKPKVRYAVVPNYVQDWLLPRFMPARALDRTIAGRLGMTPEQRPS